MSEAIVVGQDPDLYCPELVSVDPARLDRLVGAKQFGDAIRSCLLGRNVRPLVLGGDWDRAHLRSFDECDSYRACVGFFVRGEPWEGTAFYRRVVDSIARGNPMWGCRSEEAFRNRLYADLPALFDEIRRGGFKAQDEVRAGGGRGILRSKNPDDEVRIAVDRVGRLLFLDGRHRLSIAKILGLRSIPAKIVLRHADWWEFRSSILDHARRNGGRIYQRIDHPDLSAIPAAHGDERTGILRDALLGSGYDPRGRRVIDVGAHWGAMCHELESLGFDCVALESRSAAAGFCRRLRDACERRFEVWEGDALEFDGYHRAQVVLALSIFHHFIKTEELHAGFLRMLERMRGLELMMFQAHRADPPGQMAGAFRNYDADAFARLIARHTGLCRIHEIGVARDGRRIYWLARADGPRPRSSLRAFDALDPRAPSGGPRGNVARRIAERAGSWARRLIG